MTRLDDGTRVRIIAGGYAGETGQIEESDEETYLVELDEDGDYAITPHDWVTPIDEVMQ